MQIITDIMAWKPKLDTQRCWYFRQAYEAECRYMTTLLKLVTEVLDHQMANEFKENRKIRDYLWKSFKIADDY